MIQEEDKSNLFYWVLWHDQFPHPSVVCARKNSNSLTEIIHNHLGYKFSQTNSPICLVSSNPSNPTNKHPPVFSDSLKIHVVGISVRIFTHLRATSKTGGWEHQWEYECGEEDSNHSVNSTSSRIGCISKRPIPSPTPSASSSIVLCKGHTFASQG